MSLNWNAKKMDASVFEAMTPTDLMVLSYGLMGIGIGEIKDSNYREVAYRLFLWEKLNGSFRKNDDGEDKLFSLSEVQQYIGFSTNVGNETRAAWLKRLAKSMERDFNWLNRER